jgi:hypothetical protein
MAMSGTPPTLVLLRALAIVPTAPLRWRRFAQTQPAQPLQKADLPTK